MDNIKRRYHVVLYETQSGQFVVEKFINSLEKSARAKLAHKLLLLEEYGIELSMPHAKPMGRGLYELRVRGKTEIRIFYVFVKARRIYLLHGFVKKTQETPTKEINIAMERKRVIESL